MATSLAAQLAQIAANSKTSLNVKAQKAAHSKSLIFEPRVAASQSFQTLYTTCIDGFDELCLLDSRFAQFRSTLFSEQSKDEDRTQMTAAENAELDKRIESFLRLLGGRLRLMPAVKATEWLIRRFRIHDFNTVALLTTFIPYHTMPIFLTVMSILPTKIPNEYRFLDPYIRSLSPPPRTIIVHQAIQNAGFLTALSENVLTSCRLRQHYPAMIAFWSGIMTEAVNGILDKTRSGRKSIQVDNDQSLLHQIGPTLSEGLVMRKAPDLQIATYMVVSILASKGNLPDSALSAFMEQVVHGWNAETLRPGLVCLAILARFRSAKQISGKVTKALLKIDGLLSVLLDLAQKHAVDKLAYGFSLSLVERVSRKGDTKAPPLIKAILLSGLLAEKQIGLTFKALLLAAHKVTDEVDPNGGLRSLLGNTLVTLVQATGSSGESVRKAVDEVDLDVEALEISLDTSIRPKLSILPTDEDMEMGGDEEPPSQRESVDVVLQRLPPRETTTISCLCRYSNTPFDEICAAFLTLAPDEELLRKLDESPAMRRETAPSDAFYLSFYMRLWCGPYPTLARVAALNMAKERVKEADCEQVDLQALIPYCIVGLGDAAKKVRRAAADLLIMLAKQGPAEKTSKQTIWGSQTLYERSAEMKWMDQGSTRSLLHTLLLPALEESILQESHITEVLSHALNSANNKSPAGQNGLSHSARLSILASLSTHVVQSPLILVKTRLLRSLNQVRGVSGTTRTQLLLPWLRSWASLSATEATQEATYGELHEEEIDEVAVQIVLPNDKDGLDLFIDLAERSVSLARPSLIRAVFLRTRKMWPSMKGEVRLIAAQRLLELSLRPDNDGIASIEATELLRNVDLTTNILRDFLDNLQSTVSLAADMPPNKRRRTSSTENSRVVGASTDPELATILRRFTFVLELVEGSRPVEHPELLQSLFLALSDIQHLRAVVGSDLGYLQNLVLSSLLAMMPAYKANKELKIDTSVGHGDVLVSCIQRSSSPAVQNAALLLVATLAKTAPEVVLHSVMPIFTFMGTSVLRQGDDYSAHVVNQTIREVVPPLIETFRKSRRNIVASASELLSSFVIAYEHIPSHRKHDLFLSLVENLGPDDFLFALLAMFVDKYGTPANLVAFLTQIMESFSVEIQLQTLEKFLALVSDVFKPKPALSAVILARYDDGEPDLHRAALKELTLLSELLASRRLKSEVGKLAKRDDMDAVRMRDLYASLLQSVLALADVVRPKKALYGRCGDVVSGLLNLLSVAEFIKAIETLLDRSKGDLREKVLQALQSRIDDESDANAESRSALLAFLPQLTADIRETDDLRYKHTAVSCVDKIAEKYGKKDIEAVTAAASTIAGPHCLGEADPRLRTMALLCLASLADVLQDAIVPVLPSAVPQALGYLKDTLASNDPDVSLHNAAYAFITALAQYLPFMISESYLDGILACSNTSAEFQIDGEAVTQRKECLRFIAKRTEAKTLFSALERNWSLAVRAGSEALSEYLDVLSMAIEKHTKSAISKNVLALSAIFMNAFDLRRTLHSSSHEVSGFTPNVLEEMEMTINKLALKFIYKLNDAALRPIFQQLMDWTAAEPSKHDSAGRRLRQQSVYAFLAMFFDNLKSIVTSYATYVMDGAVAILKTASPTNPDERELWRRVVRTLARCFENDQDGFWQAPAHFGAVAPVLTAQFLHAATLSTTTASSTTAGDHLVEDLVPAVVELAAAADSADNQKELNSAVLRHLRSETAAVRLAAVRCEQALTERLGEDWLTMLPEMLPYISELQDDDDEVVDRETHRWIVGIESVLGESLDAMLQ